VAEAVKVRNEEERESGGLSFKLPGAVNKVTEQWQRFQQFLHEVRVEMRHVTWPTRTDVRATTLVVIATVFFFGVFLFLVDWGMGAVVDRLFKYFRP
jgi:preprotein translocase subunit SecE